MNILEKIDDTLKEDRAKKEFQSTFDIKVKEVISKIEAILEENDLILSTRNGDHSLVIIDANGIKKKTIGHSLGLWLSSNIDKFGNEMWDAGYVAKIRRAE